MLKSKILISQNDNMGQAFVYENIRVPTPTPWVSIVH